MKDHFFTEEQILDNRSMKVTVPRTARTKMLKELNYKSNLQDMKNTTRSRIFNTNHPKDILIRNQRSRVCQDDSMLSSQISSNFKERLNKSKKKISKTAQKLDGQIQIQDENGNKFKGLYKNGIRISGRMEYCQAKCVYEGSFLGEKFHGFGKLKYQNGRTIEGQWDLQQLVGNAHITYPNNDIYYGEVNESLYKHGKGYLFFCNGDKFIGEFKHGAISGVGTFYLKDSTIVKGVWVRGRLVHEVKPDDPGYQLDNISYQLQQSYLAEKQRRKTLICPQEKQSIAIETFQPFNSSEVNLKIEKSLSRNTNRSFQNLGSMIINFPFRKK